MKIGDKVLYRGEVYFLRTIGERYGLAQSIDGVPTISAPKQDVYQMPWHGLGALEPVRTR